MGCTNGISRQGQAFPAFLLAKAENPVPKWH